MTIHAGTSTGTCTSTSTSTGTSTSTSTGTSTGMNGHFKRDPDVISRLPDTTTQDLSVFICFRSQRRLKKVILDESMSFI